MAESFTEFDAVAEEYRHQHAQSISFSGEDPEYFAAYKAQKVADFYTRSGESAPTKILDFGAGIGNSVGPLLKQFPDAEITCLDVSGASLSICNDRFGDRVTTKVFDGRTIPEPDRSYDMAFVACVFHHIDEAEHLGLLKELRRVLRKDGNLFLFEHNPWNPATRIAVANCPFDENAVLINSPRMHNAFEHAGYADREISYGPFFPAFAAALRPCEKYLGWLPLGAQYMARGRAV